MKSLILRSFSLLLPALLFAEPGSPPPFEWRRVENTAFGVGERINYQIRFGVLAGGTAWQEVEGREEEGGRPAFRIVSEARTNKVFDVVHKVREKHESWMDAQSLCSLKFTETVREGSYRKQSETVLNPPQGRLVHTYNTTKHQGTATAKTPSYLQDSVSLVYFLRTLPLVVGAAYEVPFHLGGKVHPVKVIVKAIEKIRVPAGSFDCFHLIPVYPEDLPPVWHFEFWLTTDARHAPVLVKSKLAVGSFSARLTEYTPGRR